MRLIRSLSMLAIMMVLALLALDHIFSNRFGLPYRPVLNCVIPESIRPVNDAMGMLYWIALLLLPFLYVITTVAIWKRRPRALRVHTSGGETILVHPGALLKFVRQTIEDHPAVVSQKVKVKQSGSRGLAVRAQVNVQPTESLPKIHRQLDEAIRRGFSEVMGIEKINEISIVMGLDEKNMNRRPGVATPAQPKPEPPVRGELEEHSEPNTSLNFESDLATEPADSQTDEKKDASH